MFAHRAQLRALAMYYNEAVCNSGALCANYGFEQFEHQAFGMFDGDKATVTLLVKEPLMGAVADRFGSDAVLGKRTDEEAEVRVTVRLSPQFFGWIAGMDGNITIAGPQAVKNEYKEWLNKLMGGC